MRQITNKVVALVLTVFYSLAHLGGRGDARGLESQRRACAAVAVLRRVLLALLLQVHHRRALYSPLLCRFLRASLAWI